MNLSILSLVVFIAVFAGVVFIHEFGHFIVSRLLKVEVEEFGFGLPPRMLTFWRQRGYLLLRSGKRIEIPSNFDMPLVWSTVLDRDVALTADEVESRLVLRTLAFSDVMRSRRSGYVNPMRQTEILVDEKGKVVEPPQSAPSTREVKIGSQEGQLHFDDVIAEAHPGTQFTLNWLPIGGFVRPKGENDPTVPGGLAAASPWTRLAVLFAGPLMNLLLGIVVFSFVFFQMGVPDYTKVQIADVGAGSPAAQAGLRPDDIIVAANGQPITDSTQLHDIIYGNLDKPITLTLLRGKQNVTVTAVPSSKRPQGQGALGISMGPALVPGGSAIDSVRYGSLAVYEQVRLLVLLPAQMIRGQASPENSRFVGLKGIYDLFGQAVNRDVQSRESSSASGSTSGTQTPTFLTLQLIGFLTISLGVLNLFPFPALDGGRIFFVLPELLLRRRIPPEWENRINAVGMALLLAFMVYVNVMDFVNPAIVTLPK
jgi:regulator of sigma E protease